jgi:hypothetical protein
MTYPSYIREKAQRLRTERKLTIDEIAEQLSISRTTAYHWVGDTPIPETAKALAGAAAGRRKGNLAMQSKHAALREAAYREGWREFPVLLEQETFGDFVCMYVAEGSRRCRNRVALCNSNPRVIWLADHWIREFTTKRVTYSVQYHADQDLPRLQRFWAAAVNVEPAAIKVQRKSNSGQLKGRNWRSQNGVLTVCTNDTRFRMRLEAWMDRLQEGWLDSLFLGA